MFILNLFLKKRWKNITVFLCILLIAMNSSTLISDFATKNITKTSGANVEYALSEKNMNNVCRYLALTYLSLAAPAAAASYSLARDACNKVQSVPWESNQNLCFADRYAES